MVMFNVRLTTFYYKIKIQNKFDLHGMCISSISNEAVYNN